MKAVIYLRVSSKEQKQEGYSIPAQRKLLLDYARVNGFTIEKEFEDDETAKNAGRTEFGAMVEYLQAHKNINTILVEKTDRLYRNFKDYVIIDDLGVTVYLVKENEKLGKDASSHQKFIHGIKVLMAKNFIDNLSEEVKKGQQEKAELGYFPSHPPVGYKLERKNGKSQAIIDEVNRDLVTKMFEYYSTGLYSLVSLIEKIKDEGLFVKGNFPSHSKMSVLTKSSMQRILRNPFYYGDFMWGGKKFHGVHEPLISKELWNQVQGILDRYTVKGSASKQAHNTYNFPFKGLLTCGECGRNITAEKKVKESGKEYTYYRCTKFNTNCSQKATNENNLNNQIIEKLEGLKIPDATIDYVTDGLKQSLYLKRNTEDKKKQQLEERKAVLEKRIETLYEDKLDRKIVLSFYESKFTEYSTELENISNQLLKYTSANINYYEFGSKILELSKNASFLYKNANPEEKKELLGFLLSDSQLKDEKVMITYKKPFDTIYQRMACSEMRSERDSNPRPLP